MSHDFLVLGASGMQGRIVCRDLLEADYSVCLADLHPEQADAVGQRYGGSRYRVLETDLRDHNQIVAAIYGSGADVVINCAEGDWNLLVYKACLEVGVHCIDLGSDIPMTKDQLALSEKFRQARLTAITGCGSTPGINNIMLYYAVTNEFDTVDTVEAGFAWDSNIKKFVVPFSIESIIEEFTEPAPVLYGGMWEERTPLQHTTVRTYRDIGKQMSFPVRHPETYTFYRYYQKRGLQNVLFYAGFPDHSRLAIENYIESGLGDKVPRKINGIQMRPIDFLVTILRDLPYPDGYTEIENLWVEISGLRHGKPKQVLMECLVSTLPTWEDAGCNIDTGIPASIIAQMIKNNEITTRGSFAPGPVVPYDFFFDKLRQRQMRIYKNGVPVTA
ncbi:MAG: saccharopine dehydrogenase NADP-binding domain-containing protein [Candidatus Andersenbacteria bacterium]